MRPFAPSWCSSAPVPEGDEAKAIAKELRDWVAKEIGPIAKPKDIRFGENLPKTRSGKIMRRLLRSLGQGRVHHARHQHAGKPGDLWINWVKPTDASLGSRNGASLQVAPLPGTKKSRWVTAAFFSLVLAQISSGIAPKRPVSWLRLHSPGRIGRHVSGTPYAAATFHDFGSQADRRRILSPLYLAATSLNEGPNTFFSIMWQVMQFLDICQCPGLPMRAG